MTINVLHLTSIFPTTHSDPRGGFILDSINALEDLNINIQIVVTTGWKPKRGPQYNICNPHSFRYLSIPKHYLRYISNHSHMLRLRNVLKRLIIEHNIHLINAHTELCGIVAVKIGELLNIPTVVTIHGIDTCTRMWLGAAGRMIDRMLRQASRVVLVGDPLFEYFKQRQVNLEHFRVVYNGFRLYPDMLTVREKRFWGDTINFISVSNLHEGKGVDITLHALAALKYSNIKNWCYTIVGEGKERRTLEELVGHLGLKEHVIFTGLCSHTKVCELLKKADIFCLPSYREAFGIAYLEAMAYGLLAIGVEQEGPQAFIKHFETGILVQPQDTNDLLKKLKIVLQEGARMKIIAHQGRKHVLQEFTWQKHAESLLKVYEELL